MIVKKVFNVSYRTVLYRLSEKGIDYGEAQKYIYNQFRARHGHAMGGKTEPYPVGSDYPFVARRLDNLVRKAIERELISISRGAGILGITPLEMHDMIRDWDWADME